MPGDTPYGGPFSFWESKGLDAAYEAVRKQAQRDLENSMAGPKQPLGEPTGVKNPDGEFSVPAPIAEGRPEEQREDKGPGPLTSQGFTWIDPEGQQGSTTRNTETGVTQK